ncbi:MAG: PhoH family protein [Ignavibacteriaceae bacterium]|jgi:phosphate starvation-inducible PhoH-like protein|nr:PhoH family protein [Ignavibacteriales bacterium]MBP9121861.1 PhoH family protein [Ignavibacteriaceae bacterium]
MSEFEKKISLEGIDLQKLVGPNDSNIRLLEEFYDSAIIVRGELLTLKGNQQEVEQVEKIIKEMIYAINTSGRLKEQDIKLLIELTRNGKPAKGDEDFDKIILYTKDDVIKARTPGQLVYLKTAQTNDICFAIGPAGTGKTYMAVALAVAALKKNTVKKIILTRPAVEAGEKLGYLPGDLREKIDPYLRPLYDALEDMLPTERVKAYLEKGVIEIIPLAYMRGRTLNKAFVILDEAQNTTDVQMKMFLTRLGTESRAIITGDITQIDLPTKTVSGLVKAQEILSGIEGVGFSFFDKTDVVRHRLVKEIIDAYEKYYVS